MALRNMTEAQARGKKRRTRMKDVIFCRCGFQSDSFTRQVVQYSILQRILSIGLEKFPLQGHLVGWILECACLLNLPLNGAPLWISTVFILKLVVYCCILKLYMYNYVYIYIVGLLKTTST